MLAEPVLNEFLHDAALQLFDFDALELTPQTFADFRA